MKRNVVIRRESEWRLSRIKKMLTSRRDLAIRNKYKLRDKKLEKIVADLKKHGSIYTALKYCIWAELFDGELASASEPPENSMFSGAGHDCTSSSTHTKKSEVAEGISEVAKQLFNPKPSSG